MPSGAVLGFPAESVTAVATLLLVGATAALAVVTFLLFWIAQRQLPLLTNQIKLAREAESAADDRQIETNTLQACARYTGDPVVHAATQRIWRASEEGREYRKNRDKIDQHDLITVLNYLDTIAVGIKQGVYSEPMVKANMSNTFEKVVDRVIPEAVDGGFAGYENIRSLWDKWRPEPPLIRRPRP